MPVPAFITDCVLALLTACASQSIGSCACTTARLMRSSMYRKCFHSYTRQIESTYAHLRALVAILDRTPRTPSLVMEDDFGKNV